MVCRASVGGERETADLSPDAAFIGSAGRWQNRKETEGAAMSIKVSIGIPVYKVENYIERCARSLFEQTMKEDVEFIFVDDCSPDGSIEIVKRVLREYPQREDQVRIVRHETNLGLPTARNTFLDAARGEFLMAVDSDDFVDATMVEDLHGAIVDTNADLVWEDYFETHGHVNRYVLQRSGMMPSDLLLSMLDGRVGGYTWNKIARREWVVDHGLRYMSFAQGLEDLLFWAEALRHAPRVSYLNKAHYHYVQREDSIVHLGSRFSLEARTKICNRLKEQVAKMGNLGLDQSLVRFIKRWKVDVTLLGLDREDEWMSEYACVYDCGLPIRKLIQYWIMRHGGFDLVLRVKGLWHRWAR